MARNEQATARQAWAYVQQLLLSDVNHRQMHLACEVADVTPGVMKALLFFEPGAAIPMRELGIKWRCDASYVTTLVDTLEQRGLVARQVSTQDRRAKAVALTPAGERTLARMVEIMTQPPEALGVLSPDEQATLANLLGRVAAAIGESGLGACAAAATADAAD